jgi:signal transduction histidine kinase
MLPGGAARFKSPDPGPGARDFTEPGMRLTIANMGMVALTGHPLSAEWKIVRAAALAAAIVVALWLASRSSYLLFHSVVEIFSIAVACAVFMISWSSRGAPEARPFLVLGIGYLFASILDVFHLLSYQGMGVLRNSTDDATRLWVAARAIQAGATLWFAALCRARRVGASGPAFLLLGGAAALSLLSIFAWNVFPLCFVEGVGVTPFKVASEYVISAVFTVSILLIARRPGFITAVEQRYLMAAFGLTIASELVFTHYISAYGYQNLIGHYLKIAAYFLAYQALFASKIRGRLALISGLEQAKARLEASEVELRKANLSKDKFFSILAHDLRNPIGGLVSLSEVLATRFDDLDPKRVREMCRLLHDGAVQGAELLECILQWARAQTGRLEVHPSRISLSELCNGLVALLEPVAAGKEIFLSSKVAADAAAWADENMVAAVLRNLLSNAVKFTPRGGSVAISSTAAGDWQELSVADSGIGMNPEQVAKLFRIDVHFSCPGTEAEKGSGMGLILCKELVHLNQGTISVRSEPTRGTTFSLRLPREKVPSA